MSRRPLPGPDEPFRSTAVDPGGIVRAATLDDLRENVETGILVRRPSEL